MTETPLISTGDTAVTGTELSTARRDDPSQPGAVGGVPQDIGRHQLAVAQEWVRRGYPVVPCNRRHKGALVGGFGKDASDEDMSATFGNPEAVTDWWSGPYRRAHVGLLTGRGKNGGLLVVDCDVRKDGAEISGRFATAQSGTDVLEALAAGAGAPWPDTYTVLTPSGGMHLYFLNFADDPIGCATGDGPAGPHLGPLVDVRGLGGYVIAAGSYSSAQGRMYERVSPPELLPQPIPAWLLALLRRPAPPRPAPAPVRRIRPAVSNRAEKAASAALDHAVGRITQAPEGELNRSVFAAARWLGELAHTAPAILAEAHVERELLAAAVAAGHPERGAVNTIRSGWNRGNTPAGMGAA